MGLRRLLLTAITALAGFGQEIRLASKTAVQSVRVTTERVKGSIAASLGYRVMSGKARRKRKASGRFGRRGKYKGRLHARRGSRKRGSGRTAARIAQKGRRHG